MASKMVFITGQRALSASHKHFQQNFKNYFKHCDMHVICMYFKINNFYLFINISFFLSIISDLMKSLKNCFQSLHSL